MPPLAPNRSAKATAVGADRSIASKASASVPREKTTAGSRPPRSRDSTATKTSRLDLCKADKAGDHCRERKAVPRPDYTSRTKILTA